MQRPSLDSRRWTMLAAGLIIGVTAPACSDDGDTSAAPRRDGGPPAIPGADGGPATGTDGGPAKDASGVEVGPVTLGPADPTCDPGEPTSCCFGTKKYGVRAGADKSCGPNGDEDCCKYDDIPGGTFTRSNDAAFPATLPGFKLGRYLVTTARFKVWMEEGGGLRAKAPAPGAGAHPTIPGTGWKAEWNAGLSETPADLALKVYRDPGSNGWGCTLDYYPQSPRYPVSCIDWYQMHAFCAWDGGYPITEAMWEYASRGGDQQRKYAWGAAPPTSLDESVYCISGGGEWGVDLWCNNPTNPVPRDVGHSKNGAGRWGTHDLMGNLLNVTMDDEGAYPVPCTNDCVSRVTPDPNRAVARGISFAYPNTIAPTDLYGDMITKRVITVRKSFNGANFGFRCAYPNSWPSK